jgi:hypothetical protein
VGHSLLLLATALESQGRPNEAFGYANRAIQVITCLRRAFSRVS